MFPDQAEIKVSEEGLEAIADQAKGRWNCKGLEACPSDSCEGSRGQVGRLRGRRGARPQTGQGSRGHKGRALEVSRRTCRRDWGSSSQPAAATHYRRGGDTAGAKRRSWDLELGYK